MKKEYFYVPLGIIVVIFCFWAYRTGFFNPDETKTSASNESAKVADQQNFAGEDQAKVDSLQKLVNECYEISVDPKDIKEHFANLQKAYNKCNGILTTEEELALLKDQMIKLRSQVGKKEKTEAPILPNNDIREKQFKDAFSIEKEKKSSITVENFGGDNRTLSTTLYEGGLEGEYCTTIDATGRLLFAIKNSVFEAAGTHPTNLRLNGENGQELTLSSDGWWYCTSERLISVQEINNPKRKETWSLYMGIINYGSGSYPAYAPHQFLKTLINKVRGKEWGEITDNDLLKMRAENPNIWTPDSDGSLMPFRLDSENGRAVGNDKNIYQGWVFLTPIFAKKRTTIN